MLTANAKRIAWFMQLQRIRRFQKYYLAPGRAPLGRHKTVKDDFTAGRSGSFGLAEKSFFTGASDRISVPEYPKPRTPTKPMQSLGIPGAGMIMPGTMIDVLRRVQTPDVFWAARPTISGLSNHKEHIFRGAIIEPGHPAALGRQEPLNDVMNSPTTSQTRLSVGGIFSSPRVADALASFLLMAPSASTNAGVEGLLRAPPPPEEETGARQFSDKAGHAHPDASGSASNYEPQQHKAVSAATIHIDGSALGRWAIQHLERALGKPATGMTGVDPRASLPRSRVSPF